MRKRIILGAICLLALCDVSSYAQNKVLSMKDAIIGPWRDFYPESINNLDWRADKNEFSFVEKNAIMVGTPKHEAEKLLDLETLNAALSVESLSKLSRIPAFSWKDANTIQFFSGNSLVHYKIQENKAQLVLSVDELADNQVLCDSNNKLAYTLENNLYFVGEDGVAVAVTSDTDKNIVSGQTVSRSEYGIDGGIFWSPNGANLAFYRKDESKVTSFPLIDINTRVGDLREIKYPMAGMSSEKVSVGVFNLENGKTVWLKVTDFDEDRYLTNVSWGAKGEYLYIQVLNRASNHMKLNKYNAATGEFVKTLLEEKDDRWVEPQHKLIFLKTKPNQFIYQSNTAGFNHMFLYTSEGKLIKKLTSGDWLVTKVLGFDKAEKNLFYESTEVSPIERHVYKLNMKTGKRVRLTEGHGVHNVKVSKTGAYIIDNYSSLNVPRIININDSKGKVVKNLVKAENKLKDYNLGEISLGTIKSADNKTDLHYRLVKPADFDPSEKYPVVIYVYGGPHAQMVTDRWLGGASLWEEYMAQRGYVVFTLDNRGSSNRGKEFEAIIHRQCGQAEMADQMKGVDFLKSQTYVDADRIGVHGWSYGGFMTISLITNYPDVFKVAVAGGPVIDWKWYEIMYGERYMDTPQENPEGYAKVSLISKAKDLKGKLLICQGVIDKTVVWQNSLNFIRECIKNNVQVDYFPYPRAEHNVRGMDRIHLKQKVSNYFDDYLK
ncbi:DPP IV N-terminal domain-containing protein [Ancylomarina sp. 16SWW S1-10-2]|uniref:S9 family peptidase n=1 Tax=Ancylomarina sp. 16SWW S1-10-2 TaxID=2499681 RepID=UPI0012AE0E17|nr:DPP IV N-terminal domain-containing protein [Ancylomarina sp. 16SWW S1-10-2]MRT93352.1 S9 family peptidase [Ancylomarina sp. 16SWW S1-10-2]